MKTFRTPEKNVCPSTLKILALISFTKARQKVQKMKINKAF